MWYDYAKIFRALPSAAIFNYCSLHKIWIPVWFSLYRTIYFHHSNFRNNHNGHRINSHKYQINLVVPTILGHNKTMTKTIIASIISITAVGIFVPKDKVSPVLEQNNLISSNMGSVERFKISPGQMERLVCPRSTFEETRSVSSEEVPGSPRHCISCRMGVYFPSETSSIKKCSYCEAEEPSES